MRRHLMLLLLFFLMPTVYGQTNIALNPNAPVIDPSNASQLALLAELELQGAQDVVWSPGGLRIAILSGSRVYLYSTQDMSASPTIIDTGATVKDMAFNPDGLLLAVATLDDRLRLFSVTNSTIFAERSVTAYDIAYSNDGSLIAYIGRTDEGEVIDMWNPLTDEITRLSNPADNWIGVAFNQDSSVLSAVTQDREVYQWDMRTAELVNTLTDVAGTPAFGGPFIARDVVAMQTDFRVVTANSTRPDLVVARNGENPPAKLSITIPDDIYPDVSAVAWHPTSAIVAAGIYMTNLEGEGLAYDGVYVWFSGQDGDPYIHLPHVGVVGLTFSPDGQNLISVGNHRVRLWGVSAGRVLDKPLNTMTVNRTLAYCQNINPSVVEQVQQGVSHDIFWSWYATELEDLYAHMHAVNYDITLNGQLLNQWVFLSVPVRDTVNNGDWTVYYHMPLKTVQRGEQLIQYRASWYKMIFDGYTEFGPDTDTEFDEGQCVFRAD